MTRLIAVCAVLTALFGAAASSSSSGTKDVKLTLVAYSTPREAYQQFFDPRSGIMAGIQRKVGQG